MGKLVIGYPSECIEMNDRTLCHLRAVILAKLRRNEKFAFTYRLHEAGGYVCTTWIQPTLFVQFRFDGDGNEKLNPAWLNELTGLASSSGGLRICDEPPTT